MTKSPPDSPVWQKYSKRGIYVLKTSRGHCKARRLLKVSSEAGRPSKCLLWIEDFQRVYYSGKIPIGYSIDIRPPHLQYIARRPPKDFPENLQNDIYG